MVDYRNIPDADALATMSVSELEHRLTICEMAERLARKTYDNDALLYYAEAVDALHYEISSRRLMRSMSHGSELGAFALGAALCAR
jgi:hypothetical protein